MKRQPRLALVARALGWEVNALIARAASLGIVLGPGATCPKELLDALEHDVVHTAIGRERVESGARRLERVLREVRWEEVGATWLPSPGLGLGELKFDDRSIIVVDDEHAGALAFALRAARWSRTLFLDGRRGVGKEAVARACHVASGRSGLFISVNCAAIQPNLAEADFCGVVKGAVTDVSARIGALRAANGGTLFLDEVGALPPGVQPKLLRILQEWAVKPVGQEKEELVDVLVIAASNEHIPTATAEQRFRADLWDRISLPSVKLPALISRPDAILTLAMHFLECEGRKRERCFTFDVNAIRALVEYSWPGNVRELEHVVQTAVINLDRSSVVRAHHLPFERDDRCTEPTASQRRFLAYGKLGVEAKYLRAQGLSYDKIAAKVGLTKRKVYRLLVGR